MNVKRGHETEEHREAKRDVGAALAARGWLVAFEHGYCDIVAHHPNLIFSVGIEIERSLRNATKNVLRDLAAGCDLVVSVATGELRCASLRARLERDLPPNEIRRVLVTTVDEVLCLPLFRPDPDEAIAPSQTLAIERRSDCPMCGPSESEGVSG